MFPRYTSRGLFDIDNFFGETPMDPINDVASQFQRMTTGGYPTYNPRSWEPITRMNQATPSPVSDRSLFENTRKLPRSETFRIRMALPGYQKEDIKTSVEKGKLVVFAKHVDWITEEDYSASEIKRHFFIPENCNFGEMKTHYDGQRLYIDIPLKLPRARAASSSAFSRNESTIQQPNSRASSDQRATSMKNGPGGSQHFQGSAASLASGRRTQSESETFDYEQFFKSSFRPSIVDVSPGKKKLVMSIPLQNVGPEQINLSLRDYELTLKIEERENANRDGNYGRGSDNQAHLHYVHRTQLPPKTELDGLRSRLDGGVLYIEAPYRAD